MTAEERAEATTADHAGPDADRFYWIATSHTTTSKLFSVGRGGGAPRELWSHEARGQLATDGEFV